MSTKDSDTPLPLTPEDIRGIRERLGLSKAEAGELLGGGPRAFTKYENGGIRPAASVANLLRVLDSNPQALRALTGAKLAALDAEGMRPFEVSGQHIAALSDRKLANLTRRVLAAEAWANGIAQEGIHVAAKITVPDGGEDARIEWSNGPEKTSYLPTRAVLFQLKATDVSPAEASADILTTSKSIEPQIRDVLEAGGAYIVLCSRSLTRKQIKLRVDKILSTLASHGISASPSHVQFRDADQLAAWVNTHPSVVAWVLQHTQPGIVGPFRDWTHWSGRHEHESSPFVSDDRLATFGPALRQRVSESRAIARVVGGAGVGKSRLVFEALGPTEGEEGTQIFLSDLVLYAVEAEVGAAAIKAAVQTLADASVRAILVVDRCSSESHNDLSALTKHSRSNLSLITIDHEDALAGGTASDVIPVTRADAAVIDGILKQRLPKLPSEDHRRLRILADGFPRMAILAADAWIKSGDPLACANDDSLINSIVLGRSPSNVELLRDASMRLGAFGHVGFKPPLDEDLAIICGIGKAWRPEDLRSAYADLAARGVVQHRGRLITLQPLPVSMVLAERQWKQWSAETWDLVLCGELPERLRTAAAKRLAFLNSRPQSIAAEVARRVCRFNGPLASIDALSLAGNAEVLSSLAEIDTTIVVTLLERVLGKLSTDELRAVSGDTRRRLVRTLEKIAFVPETFERGALLLFELAVAENEKWSNNATGQFKQFFPALLGDTQAGPDARLNVLDEVFKTEETERLLVAVEALLEGARMHSFTRGVGSESHGSRPALQPWQPKLWKDAWAYVTACVDRLSKVAVRGDAVGGRARDGLGHSMRSLVAHGLLELAERVVIEVSAKIGYWPQALGSLGDVLQYDTDRVGSDTEQRVRALIEKLKPDRLGDRTKYLVTEMPWDYPEAEKLSLEERGRRQRQAITELAAELLANPAALMRAIPQISRGGQRMAFFLGFDIAQQADDPISWRAPIMKAVEETPADERNFDLLTGYFAALSLRHASLVQDFKAAAVESAVFAPCLPNVCWSMNISAADVKLVCHGISIGTIPVRSLFQWACGGVLAKLPTDAAAPLFDFLFQRDSKSFSMGIDLLGMYVHGNMARLEQLRPQLLLMARVACTESHGPRSQSDAHHFRELMGWILGKGPDDADARATAASLAERLAQDTDEYASEIIRPLLGTMLSRFADTVWPILGAAIASDQTKAWHFEHAFGDKYSFDDEKNPSILSLPQETLFAWCHANPNAGPKFVATLTPLLRAAEDEPDAQELYPLTLRLLNEFGDREDVLNGLSMNLHTFGWSGSRRNYFARYIGPLSVLKTHRIGAVRRWAQKTLAELENDMDGATVEDAEHAAEWDL